MKKIRLIHYVIIGLFAVLESCPRPQYIYTDNPDIKKSKGPLIGQKVPSTTTHTMFIVQGKISEGTITINKQAIFAKDEKSFSIKKIVHFSDSYKNQDIYMGKTSKQFRANSSEYHFPKSHEILIEDTFIGTMHIFTHFWFYHHAGSYTRIGNFSRDSIYGKALATELKAQGITDMYYEVSTSTRAPLYPIGEKERIFITESSKPEKIRALIQAAKAVKDPRLLVIERASSTGKVSITAFGETTQIDAGTTYIWQFSEAQRENLRQFVVKRKH